MTELEKLASLPGLITNEQGLILSRLASQVPAGQAIVEIGSYRGKSTCYLAHGAGEGGPQVYAIDPWDLAGNVDGKHHYASQDTRVQFRDAVAWMGYGNRIYPIRGFSVEVAKEWHDRVSEIQVGLLYIDGDHSEESVRSDLRAWLPYLAEESVVAFDDLDTKRNPGVRVVVDEVLAAGPHRDFQQFGGLGVFWFAARDAGSL